MYRKIQEFIVYLLLGLLLSIVVSSSFGQQNQNTQEQEIEILKNRVSELEGKLQTVENVEKMELAAKLINSEFGKFERELRNSNDKWLWGWTTFFVAIVAIVVTVTGVAFWVVVKSMIANRVEENLKEFQESVEQVKIQQEKIRIIEREYAALMLAKPQEISEGGEYIYPDTVMSLSKQTIMTATVRCDISITVYPRRTSNFVIRL